MNKNIFTFISFFFFALTINAQNRFTAGLKLGVVTSQVDGDTYEGYSKFGIVGGATLNANFNKKWSSQFEILFTQKGSRHVGDANIGDYSYYLIKLNYMEVPLLIQYKYKKITFEAGPGFGFLIGAKEFNEYGEIFNSTPFNKTEIAANFGIYYTLYKNLGLSWRYSYSMLPIRKNNAWSNKWNNSGQYNNVMALSLNYTFGNAEKK